MSAEKKGSTTWGPGSTPPPATVVRSFGPPPGPKPSCCAKAGPSVVSNYAPKGTKILDKVKACDDLLIYEAPFDPVNKPTKLIICAYDIFGFHSNTKEVCDVLAESTGFRVILPDFYRGDYWEETRSIQLMFSWVTYHGSWKTAKSDILNIIEHYKKEEGITSVGMFGFCWGGKMSTLAGIEIDDIRGIGLVHPSGVEIEEADRVNCPVILLPSRDEINLLPFRNKVLEKHGAGKAKHLRFDNMNHGFCAARGDFSKPDVRNAVDEVIRLLAEFFCEHL